MSILPFSIFIILYAALVKLTPHSHGKFAYPANKTGSNSDDFSRFNYLNSYCVLIVQESVSEVC